MGSMNIPSRLGCVSPRPVDRRIGACATLVLLATFCSHASAQPAGSDARLPNFVVIFADDLGYGDLGCFGHPTIRTPHLDRMASEGMKWTQFYSAAPVCTPSRAALLTGRLPVRSGMCSGRRRVLFPNSKGGLPAGEVTIAELLKTKGYATACVGKWHLGHLPEFLPTTQGFDSYYGIPYSNDMDRDPSKGPRSRAFLNPKFEYWNVPLMRDARIIERPADQRTITRRYTEEAVRFVNENKDRPFFLYLPHSLPHVPLFASKEFLGKSPRGLYGDVVEEIDWSVGEVLATLRKNKIERNTLVVFCSDNGPWLPFGDHGGSAGLLRGGKGSTWEGGMREPTIMWRPGTIRPGVVTSQVASTMDLLATFAGQAGAALPKNRTLDSHDLTPVLAGKGGKSTREILCYYRGTELFALRKGPWKLHLKTQPGYGGRGQEVHDPPLLFHVENDPSESRNVAAAHPDVVAELKQAIEKHRATVKPVASQLER
jgi:arylsulfatase A-like enzyme